jgi:hypothetical protein
MNIYESLASTIIIDNGSQTFVSTGYWGGSNNYKAFWHWVLLAFGEGMYELPAKYRLVLPAGRKEYGTPQVEIRHLLALGLSPKESFTYKSATGLRESSPINVATALLKYGGLEQREAALSLLDPAFLVQAYKDEHAVSDFVQPPKHLNPYTPQDFGLERLPYSAFVRDGHFYAVDGISCAAWFGPEYLQHVFNHATPSTWFNTLLAAHAQDSNFWEPYLRGGARKLLRADASSEYTRYAKYLHYAGYYEARDWLRRQRGVQALLWATLVDASPEEMAKGLKVIATGSSTPVTQAINLLGRSLTIADFRELTPLQALRILYSAPFACVEDVIRQHSGELGGMFFALTSHLQMVTDCMVNHTKRGSWAPVTGTRIKGGMAPDMWDTWAKQMVSDHLSALSWRNRLLEACEPAVAFLAVVLEFGKTRVNELPLVAIESVLQSHPRMEAVMEIVLDAPANVRRLLLPPK